MHPDKEKHCICRSTGLCMLATLALLSWCSGQPVHLPGVTAVLQNPVLDEDFPDPAIIQVNGVYYGYATQSVVNGKTWNIQSASSTDLQHWKRINDVLPQKPVWASTTQDFWAPHVLYDAVIKKYVLFFSAKSDDTTTDKCIGVAFADAPAGPFTDKGAPLVCGKGFVNIDPMAFVDPVSNRKFLYWGSGFEPIRVQELTSDWQHFKPHSVPVPVVWPGKEKNYTILLEGAWVDYAGGKYYLYYSGDNCCGPNAHYAVMVARADKPTGPFTRLDQVNGTGSSVILEKDDQWLAPGHNAVFRDKTGAVWMAYHAIRLQHGLQKAATGARVLCISRIQYKNGWPVVVRSR